MKRIVFINQDSGYLMIDLINAFTGAGISCVLITGRLVVRNSPLHPTVKVKKIIRYNRSTILRRLFSWTIGFLQIWWKVVTRYRNDDLFIVSNPPFAPLLPLFVKNTFNLLIFDIYPDALVEAGYFSEKSFLIKWWQKSNWKAYMNAGNIFTISEGMKQVLERYAYGRLIKVVPIWTDNIFLKPVNPSVNPFIKKHNLAGKFVVMYSGNLGLSADVEIMADIAAEIKRDDIVFLIVGEGVKKEMIRDRASRLGLSNLILLPWQPAAELPYSLSSADIAVVFLGKSVSKLAIPSKLYNFLSVGAPLLCITPKGSEVENLVKRYECGNSFEPFNIKEIKDYIVKIADNKELQSLLRTNSLKASKDFSILNVRKFLSLIN